MLFKVALQFPREIFFVGRISYGLGEINPNIGEGAIGEDNYTRNISGEADDRVVLEGGRISRSNKSFFNQSFVGKRYSLVGTQEGNLIVVLKDKLGDGQALQEFFEKVSCFIGGVERLTKLGHVIAA